MNATSKLGWLGWLAVIGVAGFAGSAVPSPRSPRAPEVASERWLNSRPLHGADLRGKVRVVEFWTFRCINCIRTVPAMRSLFERFGGGDVIVIGVHTPELEEERDPRQLGEALERLGIRFPVATDNDYANWRAFGNRYWPALYLVDKRGVIRHTHVGELHQGTAEWNDLLARIEALRREPGSPTGSRP